MISLEAKPMQTHRSGMNVFECMQSSFEDNDDRHQQVIEDHCIEYLLLERAGNELNI